MQKPENQISLQFPYFIHSLGFKQPTEPKGISTSLNERLIQRYSNILRIM